MKKVFLVLVVISLTFTSCSPEDDYISNESNIPEGDLDYPEKIFEGDVKLNTPLKIKQFGAEEYTVITGVLYITDPENINITNLNDLYSLSEISKGLMIVNNPNLTDLSGLNNLTLVRNSITIVENTTLTIFCGINSSVFNDLDEYTVNNNAYNPTKLDLIDGNCIN